jgi:hypothetical protein
MSYRLGLALGLLVAAAPALYAQTPTPPKTDKVDKYAPEFQKLSEALQKKQQALFETVQKAPQAEQMKVYTAGMTKLGTEFGPQFLALANKAKETISGLRARLEHFELSNGPGTRLEVPLRLARDIVRIEGKNPDMTRALTQFGFLRYNLRGEDVKQGDVLVQILADAEQASPFPGVKAQAMFERGQVLSALKRRPESLALMKAVVAKYPTTGGADQARRTIFELEKLQIGMAAPDIQGRDENDAAFKLSDYKGKVVVLDFWGFW